MAIHDSFYTERFRAVSGFYKEDEAPKQVAFFEQAIPLRKGCRVLDLACGYGRHAVALARKGYAVTGYDMSSEYIRAAEKAAGEADVDVSFERVDMRETNVADAFDVVLSLSTSLAFYDDDTNEDILRRIHAALTPGGVFVFDQANIFWLIEWLIKGGQGGTSALPDGRTHHCTFSFDAARLVLSRRSVLEGDGKREEAGWDIRYYTLPELGTLLRHLGFRVRHVYGDYDGCPYALDSKRLITIAERQ